MRMFLEPTEPLLFRTGRPFDAGNDVFAETMFPPTPETLQGALRAAIATHWDRSKSLEELFKQQELIGLIGSRTGYGRFRITSLALGRRREDGTIERLFPPPAHLLYDKRGILRTIPQEMEEVYSTMPAGMQFLLPERNPEGKLKPLNVWLTEQGLKGVLSATGNLANEDIVRPIDIYKREPRLGIGMQNVTKTTREGFLYQVQMIRMQPDYGFVVDIRLSQPSQDGTATTNIEALVDDNQTQSLLRLPDEGWITLGGERRTARFTVLDPTASAQEVSVEQAKSGRLLYLATPAYFKGGWQPENWPASLGRPIAAAIHRYQPIGGWLLNPGNSGGENKAMRRCVPAGSLYFFEQPVTIVQPLTDYAMEIGYGISYTGER